MNQILPYIKLAAAALLPVAAAVILQLLETKTAYGRQKPILRQIICGIVFGALAIVGTEWGIDISGALINCRDAAVLVAGLMFGGPAGIIAGTIGAIERWMAAAFWDVGQFTVVACTVSTFAAGLYAAALRKFMFENKRPGWLISFAVGVVIEVFHMTMVFLTNMDQPQQAMRLLKNSSAIMIAANAVSVMLAAVFLSLLARGTGPKEKKNRRTRISQTIQLWLLVTVILAFIASSLFVFNLQDRIATDELNNLLTIALDEAEADIRDASDENLLSLAWLAADEIQTSDVLTVAHKRDIAEINVVNADGIITESTNPAFVGYDMAGGEQSAAFLCLLSGEEAFVQDYGPITADSTIFRKYAGVRTGTGFVQIGYDALRIQRDIDNDVVNITKNRHVGQTGYILIVDKTYSILSAPEGVSSDRLTRDLIACGIPGENTTFRSVLDGVDCCLRSRSSEGYIIISVLPADEALQTRNVAITANSFMEVLVFAVMFGLIYMLIKRVVVNRITDVNRSLARITEGDLGVTVDVRSSEEFSSLSDGINQTVDTLKRYIDEASARIDDELNLAKSIQASALPNVFPAFPKRKDFDIYASMTPANEVGGDFYDFYMTGTDTLHMTAADVSGKGIPAAMFMMRAKTELKSLTETGMPLGEVFTHANDALCEGNDAGMFVTAWQGSLDLETGLLTFANAGHNPPLLRHADGRFTYLRTTPGLVLAGMEGVRYRTQTVQLTPGDVLYLYTDGVTEATDASGTLYGEQRLEDALNARDFDSMQELCAYVKAEVDAFVGEAPQFDDITMTALHYIGTPPPPTICFEKASIDDITAVTAFIEDELGKLDCPMKAVVQISVAIDELYSNIVRYGYPDEPGPVTVKLIFHEDTRSVFVRFEDEGIPYNPLTRADPDVTLSAEERSVGGLGIYMVKKTMDDIRYKYENGRNVLTIEKRIGEDTHE